MSKKRKQDKNIRNRQPTLSGLVAQQGQDGLEVMNQRAEELSLIQASGLATPDLVDMQCVGPAELTIEAGAEDGAKPKKFSMTAYTGIPMQLRGYFHPVIIDIDGMDIPRQTVPIDQNHDVERIVGHSTAVEKSQGNRKLFASGLLSGHHPSEITAGAVAARQIVDMAANGFPWQASVTAIPDQIEFLDKGQKATVNGRAVAGPMYVARHSTLKAISIVAIGADGNTSTAIAASQTTGTLRMDKQFLQWLQAQGIAEADFNSLTEPVRNLLQASWQATQTQTPPAVVPPNTPPPTPTLPDLTQYNQQLQAAGTAAQTALQQHLDTWRNTTVAETTRQQELTALCASFDNPELELEEDQNGVKVKVKVSLCAHAIKAGWTRDQTELAARRAMRAPASNVIFYSPSQPVQSAEVLTVAALQATGYSFTRPDPRSRNYDIDGRPAHVPDTQYSEQAQDAAHKLFHGRVSLGEVMIAAAVLGGFRGRLTRIRDDGDIRELLRYGFLPQIQADGFSTASLPGILSNLQNKFLLQGYWAVNMVWRLITATKSVKDFKLNSSYNLTGDFTYKKVGPNGEMASASTGEETFTNKVETYARIHALTRQMLINDDLGALTTIPLKMGRGSALAINKIFWTTFMAATIGSDASTFFTDTAVTTPGSMINPNHVAGSSTALSSTSLATAEQLFNEQVDANGDPLGSTGKYLLHPPALRVAAAELNNSTKVVGPTSSKTPDVNIFNGLYQPVGSPYLANSSFSGYSSKRWYLMADSLDVPVIEMAFLNGQETPTVRTFEASPGMLGATMEAFHDFGCSLQNKRGVISMKGEA